MELDFSTSSTYVVGVSKKAIASVFVGEAFGLALQSQSVETRRRVAVDVSKSFHIEFPEHAIPEQTGRHGGISRALQICLNLLIKFRPESFDTHFLLFSKAYTFAVEQAMKVGEWSQFMLGSAIAYGHYSALIPMSLGSAFEKIGVMMLDTLNALAYVINRRNLSAFLSIAFMQGELLKNGYYGKDLGKKSLDIGVTTGKLAKAMKLVTDNHHNWDVLINYPARWIDKITYLETVYLKSIVALTHIDHNGEMRPLDMLGWVINGGLAYDCTDSLSLYCSFACASEGSVEELFPKSLTSTFPALKEISFLLDRLVG